MRLVIEAAVESRCREGYAVAQQGLGLLQHEQDVEIVQARAGNPLESAGEMPARDVTGSGQSFGVAAKALTSRQQLDRPGDQTFVVSRYRPRGEVVAHDELGREG